MLVLRSCVRATRWRSYHSTTLSRKDNVTAACCIIGDEILNGKTRDTNAHFLSKYLFNLGIDLRRVEVVPDDYTAIAESARRLSDQHDIVFTSGGIGPTHDDITYAALAKAYDVPLEEDAETCRLMQAISRKTDPDWQLTGARKRMAIFPKPSRILRYADDLWVPVVVVNENIHILPGIPRLFERLVHSMHPHLEQLAGTKQSYCRLQIATRLPESEIAACLKDIQEQVSERHVKIGSYPKWGQDKEGVRVVVSVVGKDKDAVRTAGKAIADGIAGWEIKDAETPLEVSRPAQDF